MKLKSSETFQWGAPDAPNSIATLTVDMPGDEENILSMEKFDGMLTAVECKNDTIAMTFENDATFAYAQQVWDWVNGADNRSFVMVAGPGDCGNHTNRQPYVVSSIQYDEAANKATLAATEGEWTAIAHSYNLVVGSVAQNTTKQKRDIEDTSSIDFNHDMTGSFGLGIGKLDARITCLNCSTTGQFDMEFKISQKFFVPTGASMKFSPKGVTAIAQMKLSGSGDLTDSLTKTFDILSIPISGLKIPGILDLGPFLTVSIGAQLSAITLSAGVTSGATGSLSDDAIVEMNLLNPEENKFSGWEPTVDILDVTVDGSISGGVAVFLQPSVELKAEALGKGFRIGLDLKVPNINAKLTGIISSGEACKGSNQTAGVKIGTNIGAQLNIKAFKNDDESDPLFTLQLATLDKPIAEKCFPLGPQVGARSVTRPPIPFIVAS
ncbi:hypothetical protein K458DRAFT_432549 [Lentithecium fluviatile CBS 122367]|uniref:Uncharacterized protein n=1 Tax=Lentithecium fluviatile CBS 122367 TaxID=1168545 RepID=A0A6G1IZ44_9PLEO|nr:hypothetical protein K458DRAFT_432549 [Lentithecium fluviatile CBS 122367]